MVGVSFDVKRDGLSLSPPDLLCRVVWGACAILLAGRRNDSVKRERTTGERRVEERFPVDFWAEAEQGGALYFQRVSNLSAGGCAFPQTVPQPLGTRIWLRFMLPDAPQDEIGCEGEIASVRGEGLGMGVRFVALPDGIKERIRKLAQAGEQQRST
jgi:hypothetical protein